MLPLAPIDLGLAFRNLQHLARWWTRNNKLVISRVLCNCVLAVSLQSTLLQCHRKKVRGNSRSDVHMEETMFQLLSNVILTLVMNHVCLLLTRMTTIVKSLSPLVWAFVLVFNHYLPTWIIPGPPLSLVLLDHQLLSWRPSTVQAPMPPVTTAGSGAKTFAVSEENKGIRLAKNGCLESRFISGNISDIGFQFLWVIWPCSKMVRQAIAGCRIEIVLFCNGMCIYVDGYTMQWYVVMPLTSHCHSWQILLLVPDDSAKA